MKTSRVIGMTLFLIVISFGVKLEAQEAPSATPYSGDLWRRSTLSGDWGGLRNDLAAKGVTIDMNITQVGQGVVNGARAAPGSMAGAVTLQSMPILRSSACGPADFSCWKPKATGPRL